MDGFVVIVDFVSLLLFEVVSSVVVSVVGIESVEVGTSSVTLTDGTSVFKSIFISLFLLVMCNLFTKTN